MKRFPFLLLVTLAFVSGCNEAGFAPSFLESQGSGALPPIDQEPLVNEELSKQAGLERIIYRIGPVDLPANTGPEATEERPLVMQFELSRPMWVIGFEPKIVGAQGERLPSALLRFAILLNTHEENPLCTTASTGNPFAVASSLLTDVRLPGGYGYPILPTDPIEARVILQNPSKKGYVNVSFEIALLAKPMNAFTTLKDVRPVFLEPSPCDHALLELGPNEFGKRLTTSTLPEVGGLVLAQGILSDYGAGLDLTKGKEAAPFWSAEAEIDEHHAITGLSPNPFEDASGLPFEKGAEVMLGLRFNNPSEHPVSGAFGGVMAYFAAE